MSRDTDQFDFFVSYARDDNVHGWITQFIDELLAEHRKFTGGRELTFFFDKRDIRGLDDWQLALNDGLARSRLFLAFLSPRYFASNWCRKEWKAWIDTEIAKHILSGGAAPIYFVEVPGLMGKVPGLSEQAMQGERDVARKVGELCGLPPPHDEFIAAAAPIVRQIRERRQIISDFVQPLITYGIDALRRDDLRRVLADLAKDLEERSKRVQQAAESQSTVPPYNRGFTGRLDELLALRQTLKDDRAGVICGVHGLGGIGKTELAFTYAHAFASVYPGGRFEIHCEGRNTLTEAILGTDSFTALFRDKISEDERKKPNTYFAAVVACLRDRIDQLGHVLLVLDNVTNLSMVSPEQIDLLTSLGPKLHLLATTREPPPAGKGWLILGELPPSVALDMLEKHRPFAGDADLLAAQQIVRNLGGIALAIELVAAGLEAHPTATYAGVAAGLGLADLDALAEDRDVTLRRHNHQRRLRSVLAPTLATLQPFERRALEYAALLPPDMVPLPWLRALVFLDFPNSANRDRWDDPWEKLVDKLTRLGLFMPIELNKAPRRLVRVHRLVQELTCSQIDGDALLVRQQSVEAHIKQRECELSASKLWQGARWELVPLDALANRWADENHGKAGSLLNQIGAKWDIVAEWTRAESLFRRAVYLGERAGPSHPQLARSLQNLAAVMFRTNRHAEAEPLLRRALSIYEQAHGPFATCLTSGLSNLAIMCGAGGRLREAEVYYRRAIAIIEKTYGPNDSSLSALLNNLALLLRDANRLQEVEPLLRRAWSINVQAHGSNHPNGGHYLINLGGLLTVTNRSEEAEPLLRQAIAIFEESYGPEHPDLASALSGLAALLRVTNRLDEAELHMRRALTVDEKVYGPGHSNVAHRLNDLGALLIQSKRFTEAAPIVRRQVDALLQVRVKSQRAPRSLPHSISNYFKILRLTGKSVAEARQEVEALCSDYGFSWQTAARATSPSDEKVSRPSLDGISSSIPAVQNRIDGLPVDPIPTDEIVLRASRLADDETKQFAFRVRSKSLPRLLDENADMELVAEDGDSTCVLAAYRVDSPANPFRSNSETCVAPSEDDKAGPPVNEPVDQSPLSRVSDSESTEEPLKRYSRLVFILVVTMGLLLSVAGLTFSVYFWPWWAILGVPVALIGLILIGHGCLLISGVLKIVPCIKCGAVALQCNGVTRCSSCKDR